MKIKRIVVGEFEENCYIVEKNNECIIIDPGDEAIRISENITKSVEGILVTHHHFDHVGALDKMKEKYNITKENDLANIGWNIEVIETPGHTKDSLTFYFKDDKVMFTGDFIFQGTMGRMDLPTGSYEDMLNSLEKMVDYPKDIDVYPGHGEKTVLGLEIPKLINYLK